jgi:hypothetical protein
LPDITRTVPAASSSVTTAQSIPFRTDSPVSTGQVASVLVITLLLLGIFFAVLLLARRQGWLSRWLGGRVDARHGKKRSSALVMSSTRISSSAYAHVVAVEGLQFVVFESSRQLAVHPMDVKETDGDANASHS